MNKAYKYRLYPNRNQANFINQCIGACRFVYNQALGWRIAAYEADRTSLTYADTAYGLTKIKILFPWLKDADSIALQQSLRHLDDAYRNFFRDNGSGFPKFKSKKHCKLAYTIMNINNNIIVTDKGIKIPKLGIVKAAMSRMAPTDYVLKSATVSKDRTGAYYVSVLYEYENAVTPHPVDPDNAIGLDYKSDGLYRDSNGDTCGSPKYYRQTSRKLANAQRMLSRKVGSHKGEAKSSNYLKQQLKVNKIHKHISNQRIDYLHKKSCEIANHYDLVCVEDLNMRSLSNKGFGNGKATMDNGYGMFLNMLGYKLADRGKFLIKVDKFYPSSQLCSYCGYKEPELKDLSIRKWLCPVCGHTLDRDTNAAINIKHEGLRIFFSEYAASA